MNLHRMIVRRESFGAIIGNRDTYGFNVINRHGYDLMRRIASSRIEVENIKLTQDEKIFLKKLYSLGFCDENGVFYGSFIDNKNIVPYLSAPIRVWLEITSKCNLACHDCFNENHLSFKEDIGTDEILSILSNLASAGVLQITVTGGEPLIRKDIWDILNYATKLDFGLRFFTNGTTINDANAIRLSEYPISHIFASIDGIGITNDLLRGEKSFDRIARGIKKLTSRNKNVTLSVTLHALSLENIELIFQYAESVGVKTLLIRPLLEYTDRKNPLVIQKTRISEFISELERVSIKYGVEYQLNKLPFFNKEKAVYFHDRKSDVHFSQFSDYNKFGCVAGNTVAGIKSNGMVMACGFVPIEYSTDSKNSAVENSFIALWNEAENIKILRDLNANSECGKCNLLSSCGGGCRANALLQNGDISAVDPYCFLGDFNMLPHDKRHSFDTSSILKDEVPRISERTITTKCGSGSLL